MNDSKHVNRCREIDIFRGLVFLANFPGNLLFIHNIQEHSDWNGLSLVDVGFPMFVFALGTLCVSISQNRIKSSSKERCLKALKRSLIMLIIGLILNYLAGFLGRVFDYTSLYKGMDRAFYALKYITNLRIGGVLQRLAVVNIAVWIITLFVPRKYINWLIVIGLGAYQIVLLCFHGYEYSDRNIVALIDKVLLTEAHMFQGKTVEGVRIIFEPLGIVGTVSAVFQSLIGYQSARWLINDDNKTMYAICGTKLLFLGFLLSYIAPCNRNIWSPTYVFVTTGICMLLMFVLLEEKEKKSPFLSVFEKYGRSSLFVYAVATVVYTVIKYLPIDTDTSLLDRIFYILNKIIPFPYVASLTFSILYASLFLLLVHLLHKRDIIIKL